MIDGFAPSLVANHFRPGQPVETIVTAAPNASAAEIVTAAPNVSAAEIVTATPNVSAAEIVTAAPNVSAAEIVTAAPNVSAVEIVTAVASGTVAIRSGLWYRGAGDQRLQAPANNFEGYYDMMDIFKYTYMYI